MLIMMMIQVMRETKEELATKQGRDTEYTHRKLDFEKQLELAEAETISVRNELKIAQRRIEDLQLAIQVIIPCPATQIILLPVDNGRYASMS